MRQRVHWIKLIVALILVTCVILWVVRFSRCSWMKDLRMDLAQRWKVIRQNLSDEIQPRRRRPLTTIELEERLKSYFSKTFEEFSDENWDQFWTLIFGKFPIDELGGRWPKRVRQLTGAELEEQLKYYYPHPFSYFSKDNWDAFWKLVLKRKLEGE